jgi:hypothetical protein
MKKIIALVMGIAFAFGTAGFATAQTAAPAPKTEEKKADDTKKDGDTKKTEGKKKGDKMGKKGAPKDTSMDKKPEEKK